MLLLVGERHDGRWLPVRETSQVTALGEGTKESGLLSDGGIQRTLGALRQASEEAYGCKAESIVAAATMAVRIARNSAEFLRQAEAQGTPVIVLSGDQEAELGFHAVVDDPTFASAKRMSIVDVGGQSTEVVIGEDRVPLFKRSTPIGTLGLRGGVLAPERLGPAEIMRAVREIDDAIGPEASRFDGGLSVVLGATGTNLVSIRDGLIEWQPERVHGARLSYDEVSRFVAWLGAMSDDERRRVPGMEPGRERTLHIGALILERFLHALHADGCAVSVRGWRHALLERGLPPETPR